MPGMVQAHRKVSAHSRLAVSDLSPLMSHRSKDSMRKMLTKFPGGFEGFEDIG